MVAHAIQVSGLGASCQPRTHGKKKKTCASFFFFIFFFSILNNSRRTPGATRNPLEKDLSVAFVFFLVEEEKQVGQKMSSQKIGGRFFRGFLLSYSLWVNSLFYYHDVPIGSFLF